MRKCSYAMPARVLLQASSSWREGMAVGVRFHMAEKNDFNMIVFLDAEGRAELDETMLAQEFAADRRTSPMDYAAPSAAFTGAVSAVPLGPDAVERALFAYELYKEGGCYPAGYEARLRRARDLAIPQDCRIEVRLLRDARKSTNRGAS